MHAQRKIVIHGVVKTESGEGLDLVNVSVKGSSGGTTTDENGEFVLKVTSYPSLLVFSRLGYYTKEVPVQSMLRDDFVVIMEEKQESLSQVDVKVNRREEDNFTKIDPNLSANLPDATGGSIESLVKTQMGVTSNNELSSQYRVRGGNFDENMVYVNDIEVYRPFLVRSGQQEGLSFVNPELVSEVQFSAGGFDARYGDKMSSVLDIHYKKPTGFGGSVSGSLLGGSAHFEGASKNRRFTNITGLRYKTNRYLLGTMDETGAYEPNFFDVQTYLTYQLNDKWGLSFLGNISKNNYNFVPKNRETTFGTINEVKQLKIYFDGQEEDEFLTGFGAVSLDFSPKHNQMYKLIASGYRTSEDESYDILGEYWLQEVGEYDTDGNVVYNESEDIGVGSYLQHARNYLFGAISNVALRGNHYSDNSQLEWEMKYQHERFSDVINEWEMIDSAGYSIPVSDNGLTLSTVYNAENDISSIRMTAFVQNNRRFDLKNGTLKLDIGIRGSYWDFNDELLISPRVSLHYVPDWKRDVVLRFAAGVYYQSPFYKEYRTEEGDINYDIKSQRAIHFVGGMDYYFESKDRPFKFSSEIYYKLLSNLNPYQVDNVRIRYSADNNAKGYAAGLDLKLNGEFVEGVESWASLSLMKTMEDLNDDSYTDDDGTIHYPGYIPRPSDQRLNFSLMLQDYLKNNPSFRFHLNFMYGSGLPFGPPNSARYLATGRMPSYRRIDIGFGKEITGARWKDRNSSSAFKDIWIGLEVFNLFNIDNTISYFWVTDVSNRQYAVPNYLTSRRLNFKMNVRF